MGIIRVVIWVIGVINYLLSISDPASIDPISSLIFCHAL